MRSPAARLAPVLVVCGARAAPLPPRQRGGARAREGARAEHDRGDQDPAGADVLSPEACKEPLFPWLRQQLQKLPPFFADTQLEARFRTYYLRKDRTIDLLSEAWAIGGSIYYRSGWLKDAFAVEAEGFTSQPLVAPDSRAGTGLLAPGQEGYGVLGMANAKLRYKGIVLTGYRQYLDLPFVNRNDSRMTPQTFEALTLAKDEGRLRFSTGYIWRIKLRDADEFVDMGEGRRRGRGPRGRLRKRDLAAQRGRPTSG